MKGKAALLAGLSIGYVLGTRDGRERCTGPTSTGSAATGSTLQRGGST